MLVSRENLLRNIGVRFTRADALLEKGMIVCVYCGSKYSRLLERCPNPVNWEEIQAYLTYGTVSNGEER